MTLKQRFLSWPIEKQEKFKKEYTIKPNDVLAEEYGLKYSDCKNLGNNILKLKKDRSLISKIIFIGSKRFKNSLKPKSEKIDLTRYFATKEIEKRFLEKFPNATNPELCKIFNLTIGKVCHIAACLNLKKDKQFIYETKIKAIKQNQYTKPKAEPKPVIKAKAKPAAKIIKPVINKPKPEPKVPELKSPAIKTAKVDKVFPKSHYQKQAIAKRIEAEKYEKINKGNVKSISQAIQEEIAKGKIPYYRDNKTIAFKKVA